MLSRTRTLLIVTTAFFLGNAVTGATKCLMQIDSGKTTTQSCGDNDPCMKFQSIGGNVTRACGEPTMKGCGKHKNYGETTGFYCYCSGSDFCNTGPIVPLKCALRGDFKQMEGNDTTDFCQHADTGLCLNLTKPSGSIHMGCADRYGFECSSPANCSDTTEGLLCCCGGQHLCNDPNRAEKNEPINLEEKEEVTTKESAAPIGTTRIGPFLTCLFLFFSGLSM